MNAPAAHRKEVPARGPDRVFRPLFVGAFFVAALLGTAQWIGASLPFPALPQVGGRFRYFAENKDEFDTVFIGSSRVQNQIIPQEFDAETAARGVAIHSFNLGYAGMWPPESFYLLRRVLALHPARLRWAVIELMDYRFGEAERNPVTARTVYWHDWRHTLMVWRLMAESPMPFLEKCRQWSLHASLLFRRMTNPGRGAEWLAARYFDTTKREDLRWMKHAGFDPAGEMGPWTEAARADFARQVDAVKNSLPPVPARPGFAVALRDLGQELRQAGVEPVFVIPPTLRPEENLVLGLPPGLTVFAFNRPADYPHLFVPETHVEPRHLNEKGAQEFTRLLADRFAGHAVPR